MRCILKEKLKGNHQVGNKVITVSDHETYIIINRLITSLLIRIGIITINTFFCQ